MWRAGLHRHINPVAFCYNQGDAVLPNEAIDKEGLYYAR